MEEGWGDKRYILEYNIKMDLKDVAYEDVYWIYVARDKWWVAPLKRVKN
jgi:hypothetical protein